MRWFMLGSRAQFLPIAAACAVAFVAAFACTKQAPDVHETDAVKGKACITCHSAAYEAAADPVHLNRMPQTCETCHDTKAWVPSTVKDHYWWPLQNKHAGVSCTACHVKGFEQGDTPTICEGCHRGDFDNAQNPKHKDLYPLDCAMCHDDRGFRPSSFDHSTFPLVGRHSTQITPCAGCHAGTPPKYKGTTRDCYECHKADADDRATAKNPSHPTFPHTCLDCHLMSGWSQGPPLSGLHPESSFPLTTGAHADPRIGCLDCHQLEKGLAAGGANTDCIHCHLGSHVTPDIDAYHAKTPDGGSVPGYPQGAPTTNYCLQCHAQGQHL